MTTRITTTEVFEELGKYEFGIEADVVWECTPAEPMVRYYPDGSGYPGSPATIEPIDVTVTAAFGDGWMIVRRGSKPPEKIGNVLHISGPDLLDALQGFTEGLVNYKHDELTEHVAELLAERMADTDQRWNADE